MSFINPTELYNEIVMTYISGGNADGKIGTTVYKYKGLVVATIIMDYDSNGKLFRAIRTGKEYNAV